MRIFRRRHTVITAAPALPVPERGRLVLVDSTGDTLLAEWRPGVVEEEYAAEVTFSQQLRYGRMAYVNPGPGQSIQTRKFDPRAERIVIVPQLAGG